jgi:hypothetical protein
LIEEEIVAALGGALDGGRTPRSRLQGRTRRLLRGRLDDDVLEAPETALVREALARRPRLEDDFERLVEARLRLSGGMQNPSNSVWR